jgi:anti-sigma B factor antagonist
MLMKITVTGNRLDVSEIEELNAASAIDFRKEIMKKIPAFPEVVAIDLGQTRFVDSSGLGALFAVFKAANKLNSNTRLKIINPKPHIVQLFELTQLHQLFEIESKPKIVSQSPA